jgi:hypothetical protein
MLVNYRKMSLPSFPLQFPPKCPKFTPFKIGRISTVDFSCRSVVPVCPAARADLLLIVR